MRNTRSGHGTGWTRREVLRGGAALSLAAGMAHGAGARSAAESARLGRGAEPLRLGIIGVANRGRANLDAVAGERIVALCDVDGGYLKSALERFPDAAGFADFRRMLDQAELDAVVVSTPDHTHAPATLAALERGLHVYCEKPLTHTVAEARRVATAARKAGVATQMGIQIHAEENYARVVELVRAGTIGAVREVFVWCGKGWWAPALPALPTPADPSGDVAGPPAHLDWDLWTGPAPLLPYRPGIHPADWRRFWPYGGGTLADMACHYMDLPFWALALDAPTEVEATGPTPHPEGAPEWLRVRWAFPARGERAALTLHWYDGGRRPEILAEHGIDWGSGVLFVGDRGLLLADYGRRVLLPAADFESHVAPAPTVPRSPGHHAEWLAACRAAPGERATSASFDYAGALTETVLLGAAAFRAGAKLTWDGASARAGGADEALLAQLLDPPARPGWG